MPLTDFLLAGVVALIAGLDRTALLQFMISRPIVAAPLSGWVLGSPLTGLQVGLMIELLWIGRLPVGAAIPPDDTQVAVGATALAVIMGRSLDLAGFPFTVLCTLTAMPLGKVGQHFDRLARQWNGRLLQQVQTDIAGGRLETVEKYHLRGILHFALSSVGTYGVVALAGSFFLFVLGSALMPHLEETSDWLSVLLPLAGTAVILGTINVSRALTLFSASFATALMMLWLL